MGGFSGGLGNRREFYKYTDKRAFTFGAADFIIKVCKGDTKVRPAESIVPLLFTCQCSRNDGFIGMAQPVGTVTAWFHFYIIMMGGYADEEKSSCGFTKFEYGIWIYRFPE